ncbi:hypothetical protein HPB51_026485 [Rhipicephalus microplus]|uniref:Uncharacterized protein n=1 Tax=Rhipicephalus microplus TaxID=6941 RepID=A0A9J6D2T3_RHIMP|nr:hypothetical protein HPB51_026485 [Rhipicephalus microplus]
MGPWSGRLRDYAAYLVTIIPTCVHPSISCSLTFLLAKHPKPTPGRPRPVVHGRSTRWMFLLAELSLWNEFLWVANFELREVRPGRLALACLRGQVVPITSDMQRRHSFVLIHWLLMEHRCIESVELCESRITRNRFLFRDGLRLSRNLRHVKLCYYCSTTTHSETLSACYTPTSPR